MICNQEVQEMKVEKGKAREGEGRERLSSWAPPSVPPSDIDSEEEEEEMAVVV